MPRYRLIFLPGIMSSCLEVTLPSGASRVVWDGDILTMFRTFFSEPEVLHAFTTLRPTKIVEELTVGPFAYDDIYKTLFNFLGNSLGYLDGTDFFRFPYDWRQSVFTEAQRLIDYIDNELPAGQQEIAILGHSLGALVARAAVMIGHVKLIPKGVTKVIELAPPHFGSSVALQRILEFPVLASLRRILGRYLAFGVPIFEGLLVSLVRSMPSVWELVPPATEPILVDYTNPGTRVAALDWPGWTAAVQGMPRKIAEDFHSHVANIPKMWPQGITVSVVYSDKHRTPYSFLFNPVPPYDINISQPFAKPRGDKLVWEWSPLLHFTAKCIVDYHHRTIARDPKTLSFLQKELV